jgi:hypothetical protein
LIEILEKFPFLTWGRYLEQDYIGVIGNSDNQIVSMYVYSNLHTDELKRLYLKLGEEWWWETNRQIPINVILKDRWQIFRPYLKAFITKDFEILSGPCISLDNVIIKRVKRRQIQLIKKL